ncbi:unnamed protein product [Sphagnum jensenii]|uniref:OVATE domain-containing protein n=1 Tax=Sphagnum jensenii TaxID=128206 RepID=A0ABP0WLM9_9BRYO
MCPMCEDKGWPLGQMAIETKYQQLVKHHHKPTVCAAVNHILKNWIHRSSSSSHGSVDIPTSAAAELSRSRSVQRPSRCLCAQEARQRTRSARGSLSVPVSCELDGAAAEFTVSRKLQPACQTAQAREKRGPSPRSSLSVPPASCELDPTAASRSRHFQLPACRRAQARERKRSARGSLSVPASGELDPTVDFVLSSGEHRHEPQSQLQESRMRSNVATDANLETRRTARSSAALQSRHHNRRPASSETQILSANRQRRRRIIDPASSASTSCQTIDTTCEACGAEVHVPVLTYNKKEPQTRDEKFASPTTSRQECKTSSESSDSCNNTSQGTTTSRLIRSAAVSISETVLSATSSSSEDEDYGSRMMITTPLLSRRRTSSSSSSLSSLGDWFAQEFRYLCSRQVQDELDDDAKTSLAQEFSSNSEALLLASHKASLSSSSSPEWNSEQDVRETTTQYHRSESSSSPPRSINLFSSSFQKTSRGQETDETTTTTTTTTAATKTTRSLKKKAQESAAGIIVTAAAPANYKNNKKNLKPEQVSSSPSSLSPGNVVVLLRKYGDRKDLRRIAATGSLQQSPDLQQQQREQGWKTGSQIQNRRRSRRSFTTDCNAAASKMHQTSEWTPSTQQAIASFQEEVTKMLLESTGEDEDDVHDLEAIEDFVNGYMQLNTPFYLEMVEEFFRAVCLNCFHKPLLPSHWQLQTSC